MQIYFILCIDKNYLRCILWTSNDTGPAHWEHSNKEHLLCLHLS